MVAYLQKAKDLLSTVSSYTIQQVPRAQNTQADALACLASTKDAELLEFIPVEFLTSQAYIWHISPRPLIARPQPTAR